MGKYLHLYETENAFNAAYNGNDYHEPWVSYTEKEESLSPKLKVTGFTVSFTGDNYSGVFTYAGEYWYPARIYDEGTGTESYSYDPALASQYVHVWTNGKVYLVFSFGYPSNESDNYMDELEDVSHIKEGFVGTSSGGLGTGNIVEFFYTSEITPQVNYNKSNPAIYLEWDGETYDENLSQYPAFTVNQTKTKCPKDVKHAFVYVNGEGFNTFYDSVIDAGQTFDNNELPDGENRFIIKDTSRVSHSLVFFRNTDGTVRCEYQTFEKIW